MLLPRVLRGNYPAVSISRLEAAYTYLGIALTLFASLMLGTDVQRVMRERLQAGSPGPVLEQTVFILIVYFLIYGNLVYMASRAGYLRRSAAHRPAGATELERFMILRRNRRLLSWCLPTKRRNIPSG
jgi:hypothetical protein